MSFDAGSLRPAGYCHLCVVKLIKLGYFFLGGILWIVSEIICRKQSRIPSISLSHSLSLPEMDALWSLWPYLTIPLLVVEARPSLGFTSTSLSAPERGLYYFPLYLNHFWYSLSETVVKSFHTFLGRRPWGTRFFLIVRLYSFVQFCHILWISCNWGHSAVYITRHIILSAHLPSTQVSTHPEIQFLTHSGYYSC